MRKLGYLAFFNVIVGAIGLGSIAAMLSIASRTIQLQPGEDFIEPLTIMAGSLVFGLICNVALCAGIANLTDDPLLARVEVVRTFCNRTGVDSDLRLHHNSKLILVEDLSFRAQRGICFWLETETRN